MKKMFLNRTFGFYQTETKMDIVQMHGTLDKGRAHLNVLDTVTKSQGTKPHLTLIPLIESRVTESQQV